jgi:4-amino-4-deoxy-L-arabinose transferase-like glycosyltransferase
MAAVILAIIGYGVALAAGLAAIMAGVLAVLEARGLSHAERAYRWQVTVALAATAVAAAALTRWLGRWLA